MNNIQAFEAAAINTNIHLIEWIELNWMNWTGLKLVWNNLCAIRNGSMWIASWKKHKKGNKKIGMQKIKHQINDGNKIWDTIWKYEISNGINSVNYM